MVPKETQPIYDLIAPVICSFCDANLDERYLERCLAALEKLCRKRPSPLLGGSLRSWAAGIVYFICAQNDRFVRGCPNRLEASKVAGFFGLSAATASGKASQIRKLFHAKSYDERCWELLKPIKDPWRAEPPRDF